MESSTVWYAALLLLAVVAGALGQQMVSRLWRSWRIRRRFHRGEEAERQAIGFLRRRGYRIMASQLEETIVVYVDGQPQESKIRADYLVRRGRKNYLVEVKSGQQGNIRLPHVRRQLLEYELVYRPDGVLLLDMEHMQLQEIVFSYVDYRRHSRRYAALAGAVLAAAVVILVQWM